MISKKIRRIELQRLIKSYLLFNNEATSRELAVYLDRNFGYKYSFTVEYIGKILSQNKPNWLDITYDKKDTNTAGKWRLNR